MKRAEKKQKLKKSVTNLLGGTYHSRFLELFYFARRRNFGKAMVDRIT